MRSRRVINGGEGVVREAIALAALRCFARQGLEQTTLRNIVAAAETSLGLVNYHFGSKLGLAHEVFERVAKEACDERHADYDALEEAAGQKPVSAGEIFRALIRPYIEGDEDRRLLLIYILQQQRLARLQLAQEVGSKYFDRVAIRTIAMLQRAFPALSLRDVSWRYNLALAAVLGAVSDCGADNRLKRLSGGAADTSDRRQMIEQTIAFAVHAFTRPTQAE